MAADTIEGAVRIAGALVGGGHRPAMHVDAAGIIGTGGTRDGRSAIQQRVGFDGLGHGGGQRGRSHQQHQDGAQPCEIKLRLLHCNIAKYVVTLVPKHFIKPTHKRT